VIESAGELDAQGSRHGGKDKTWACGNARPDPIIPDPNILTVYPRDGEDADSLLKHSDTAMYSVKRTGKNHYEFFDEAMNAALQQRLTMDSQMRKALENDEFILQYQRQMDMVTGRIDAAEALSRWQNPKLGPVAPLEFIPLAEENGLILPIGEWVMRAACAQMRSWQD